MTDTKELLDKIVSLRQRLNQAQDLAQEAAATAVADSPSDEGTSVVALARRVLDGNWQASLLDGALRQLPDVSRPDGEDAILPKRLTARSCLLLRRGRELLVELRNLAGDPLLAKREDDALAGLHRETAGMLETILRTVQAFPEAPTAQMRLCTGLESVLEVLGRRGATIRAALALRREEHARIQQLAKLLGALAGGQPIALDAFLPLAQTILHEARQGMPLRFLHAAPESPEQFVAAHGLSVAHVLARLLLHDPDWQGRWHEPILTALVYDVGMLRVPASILCRPGPLDDEQRRIVERHTSAGAEMVARLWPQEGWPVEAVADHHERLDGTGYPAGRRDIQIALFARLLAVCDVYVAMCTPRPHRPNVEPRTALTDTLIMADQGNLDRFQAERLLLLSFYPPGSVVELNDGAIGLVIAAHTGPKALTHPSRPIVLLLTDGKRAPLPTPHQLDLADCPGRTILRTLPPQDRRELLGKDYPEVA